MIIWAGMFITLIVWAIVSKRSVETVLKTWGVFMALSLLNSICLNLIWPNPELQSDVQFCIEVVFISSIFQQIWFGDFFFVYTAGAIVWTCGIFYTVHFLLAHSPYFIEDIPIEISFSLVNALFGFALLMQIINRYRRRFYKFFRFWLISAITVYYSFAFVAFVLYYDSVRNAAELTMLNMAALLHTLGFSLAVILGCVAMVISYNDTGGNEEMDEVFLLPKWIDRKVMFWHAIRTKYRQGIIIGNRSAGSCPEKG